MVTQASGGVRRPALARFGMVLLAALLGAGALGSPAAAASDVVCTVDDPRAVELSGLVATAEGYVSIVDSQFDRSQVVIVYLDQGCRVVRTLGYPTPPRDPEDLAVAPDGALWVADVGDNITATVRRQTIALWRIPPDGGAPVIHRLTYPDGPHDAEALLFAADGSPIVITKDIGTAGIYQATRPLEPGTAQGVPMRRVGQFSPTASGARHDLGAVAEIVVTGAATAPDRSRVALRTYTAAYEWDVPDGDVVKAVTSTPPRVTPLPDDGQGEALSYTVDGRAFLTVSDAAGATAIRRYEPTPASELTTRSGAVRTVGGTAVLAGGLVVAGALVLALVWLLVRRRR